MTVLRRTVEGLRRFMRPTGKRPVRSLTCRPALEALEDRALPAIVYATNWHDLIKVTPYNAQQMYVSIRSFLYPNYTYQVTSSYAIVNRSALLEIKGLAGNDEFTIDSNVLGVLALHGEDGTDTIFYNGRSVVDGLTVIAGAVYGPTNMTHDGVENLTVDSQAGNDQVFVLSTYVNTVIRSSGGADTVKVGDAGSVQGIRGTLSVLNPPNYTALTIDNSRDTGSRDVVMTATAVVGLAPAPILFTEADLSSLTVRGGNAGNLYQVYGTPRSSVAGGVTTTFFGGNSVGNGVDNLYVGLTNGAFVANLGAGADYVLLGGLRYTYQPLSNFGGPTPSTARRTEAFCTSPTTCPAEANIIRSRPAASTVPGSSGSTIQT